MKSPEFRYIGEDSPEYATEYEKRLEPQEPRVFGEASLEMYKWRQGLLRSIDEGKATHSKSREEIEEELRDAFSSDKQTLIWALEGTSYDRGMAALGFFRVAWDDPETGEQLRALMPDEKFVNLQNGASLLKDARLSNELFARILENHKRRFDAEIAGFSAEVTRYKTEFAERALVAISNRDIPISQQLLERRLKETQIILSDPLVDTSGAEYRDGVARASKALEPENRRHAVFHELTHAISGRIMGLRDHEGWEKYEEKKTGLHIQARRRDRWLPVEKLRWLNEAVTEDLTLQLSGEDDKGAYVLERAELKNLIDQGVPRGTILQAYFESYDPEADGEKLPGWQAMVKNIRDVKGPGWLTKQERHFPD